MGKEHEGTAWEANSSTCLVLHSWFGFIVHLAIMQGFFYD